MTDRSVAQVIGRVRIRSMAIATTGCDVLPFRQRLPAPYGSCPRCGRATGMLNFGRAHWLYCERHRTKWLAGYSLFQGWLEETPSDWLENARRLSTFDEVVPLDWHWSGLGFDAEPGSRTKQR